MTPEEARDLLVGTTPGPWEVEYDRDWATGISAPEGIVFGPYYDQEEMDQWETGSDADLRLAAAAPVLAAMIAGMREEWGVEYAGVNHGGRHTEWGYETRDEAERQARRYRLCTDMHPVRIVRRYVTEPEEIS